MSLEESSGNTTVLHKQGLKKKVGVVVKLEVWTLVVVGLADNAGVALADGVNSVKEVPE